MLEFVENKTMKETFEAITYVFHDIIDNKNVSNHFKRIKVLNFVLTVMKKLCRMQKLVQVSLERQLMTNKA